MRKCTVFLTFACLFFFSMSIVLSLKAHSSRMDVFDDGGEDNPLPTSIYKYKLDRKDGKIAIFTKSGKQLTDYLYDQVYDSPYRNEFNVQLTTFPKFGYILVRKDSAFALLDGKCRVVLPFGTYDWMLPMSYDGYSLVRKNGKWGILDKKLKVCLPLEQDYISMESGEFNSNDYKSFLVVNKGTIRILDEQAKWSLRMEFDSVSRHSNNTYFASLGNKHYLINDDCKLLSDQYDLLFERQNGFIVKKGTKMGLINYKNEMEAPFDFDSILVSYNSRHFIAINQGKYGVINNQGKTLIPFDYEAIEEAWEDKQEQTERFIVQKNGKLGTVSVRNKVEIPIENEAISGRVEHGPKAHYVLKDGKYGLVAYDGKVVLPFDFDDLIFYNPHFIVCKKNGRYGAVNLSNEELIPCEYDVLMVLLRLVNNRPSPDMLLVKTNRVWHYLNLAGGILKQNVTERVALAEHEAEWKLWSEAQKNPKKGMVWRKR